MGRFSLSTKYLRRAEHGTGPLARSSAVREIDGLLSTAYFPYLAKIAVSIG
jgi:hypothetical protein